MTSQAVSQKLSSIWKTRDELSPRNFRGALLPAFLVLPLAAVIGDLRFLDQGLVLIGIDSNNLIMMAYGLGFLPIVFARERQLPQMLRVSVLAQVVLLAAQLFMPPGVPRLLVYFAFHAANGASLACGFYLFSFRLNNVERLFAVMASQAYFACAYFVPFQP
jgi:hypothetical protein